MVVQKMNPFKCFIRGHKLFPCFLLQFIFWIRIHPSVFKLHVKITGEYSQLRKSEMCSWERWVNYGFCCPDLLNIKLRKFGTRPHILNTMKMSSPVSYCLSPDTSLISAWPKKNFRFLHNDSFYKDRKNHLTLANAISH